MGQDRHDGELRRRLVRRRDRQVHGRRLGRLSQRAAADAHGVPRRARRRRHVPGADLARLHGLGHPGRAGPPQAPVRREAEKRKPDEPPSRKCIEAGLAADPTAPDPEAATEAPTTTTPATGEDDADGGAPADDGDAGAGGGATGGGGDPGGRSSRRPPAPVTPVPPPTPATPPPGAGAARRPLRGRHAPTVEDGAPPGARPARLGRPAVARVSRAGRAATAATRCGCRPRRSARAARSRG